MKYAYEKEERIKRALQYNNYLDAETFAVISMFRRAIRKGMSQGDASNIIHTLLQRLEPPNCWMHHCEHYGGVTCFCNCHLAQIGNLIPGRCKKNKEFKKRREAKRQRETKKTYEAFKVQCKEYGCIYYTGNFCPHIGFDDNNKILKCNMATKGEKND